MCFVKSLRNTHRTHSEYDWSVYWLTFRLYADFIDFEDPSNLFRNRRVKILILTDLLAEAKCHAVWKMIV